MVRGIYCGGCRSSDGENNGPAKSQSVPKKNLKSYLLKLRPKCVRGSRQPSLPPVTESQPDQHPQNTQPSTSSLSIDTAKNGKSLLTSAQVSPLSHSSIVKGRFSVRVPKWLKFPKVFREQRRGMLSKSEKHKPFTGTQAAKPKLSNEGVASAPKALASDCPTERILEPTSFQHTADPPETSSLPQTTEAISILNAKMNVDDRSSGSRHEAAPPASNTSNISEDTLKRMEANEFPFHLTSMQSDSPARVDNPGGYPEKVTTELASSYLMSTIPPYATKYHLPSQAQKKKIIYYELQDLPDEWGAHGNIRFGFSRLDAKAPPGSGPGSFGIDRYDGNLYYNNIPVGKPHHGGFASGSNIGIGLVFQYIETQSDSNSNSAIEVRVFHTRQGVLVDDVHVDTLVGVGQDGFDGYHDLFATVGTDDRVVFEVSFEEKFWRFKPREHGF
jgi:hypothetical protein